MTTRYIRRFFDPQSIAVIGASERADSLGGTVLKNLQAAGFPGQLMAVNPRGDGSVHGVPRSANVSALPDTPELAIVCTSPARIPSIVNELGKARVRAVMIVMGGLSGPAKAPGAAIEWAHNLLGVRLESGKTLKEATWEVAQAYDMRIMGPNCIGTVVPHRRLNASYSHCMVAPGNVAYVGQSGVLALALMDWAKGREVGLSCVTSLGDSLDIDIADVIDYLADDSGTQAIIVHVEQIQSGGHFVSALRAAARSKLVIMMKGRNSGAESRGVFDAVSRRAGVLRVERTDQVFGALETLTRMRRLQGERLAVMCNGMGPALLAVDLLAATGGRLAQLQSSSIAALQDELLQVSSPGNPLDISAAASPQHFSRSLEILMADRNVDAVLVIHVPTLVAPSLATAQTLAPLMTDSSKPVLTSWMGYDTAQPARASFDAAGISTFDTPEQAVDAFMHMVKYRRNQNHLEQMPDPAPKSDKAVFDAVKVWSLIGAAQRAHRAKLTAEESVQLLAAAGIAAQPRSELHVEDLLQGAQLRLGITRDAVFGPLLFLGGPDANLTGAEVALPPLDLKLAGMLIESSKADAAIARHSPDPQQDTALLAEMLERLSALLLEVPAIAELNVHPVVVNAEGIRVFGVDVALGERCEPAILPYPADLEESIVLPRSERRVMLRPIRAEDAPAHAAFANRLSPQAIRFRFFGPRSHFTQRQLAQFTQIDYAREMAFIASCNNAAGVAETLGVVRAWTDPDNVSAEFAVIVDDTLRGEGLGQRLVEKMIDYSKQRGTLELRGTVLPDNQPMLRLAERLGFASRYSVREKAMVITLMLNEPSSDWQRERLKNLP